MSRANEVLTVTDQNLRISRVYLSPPILWLSCCALHLNLDGREKCTCQFNDGHKNPFAFVIRWPRASYSCGVQNNSVEIKTIEREGEDFYVATPFKRAMQIELKKSTNYGHKMTIKRGAGQKGREREHYKVDTIRSRVDLFFVLCGLFPYLGMSEWHDVVEFMTALPWQIDGFMAVLLSVFYLFLLRNWNGY